MFIVVTKLKFDKDMEDKIMDFSKRSRPIFKKQKGFISIRQHKAHEDSHLMSYLEWETKEDHEACMVSPDFEEINKEWGEMLSSDKVVFELNTYDIIP